VFGTMFGGLRVVSIVVKHVNRIRIGRRVIDRDSLWIVRSYQNRGS
jgi:hypothetical protein